VSVCLFALRRSELRTEAELRMVADNTHLASFEKLTPQQHLDVCRVMSLRRIKVHTHTHNTHTLGPAPHARARVVQAHASAPYHAQLLTTSLLGLVFPPPPSAEGRAAA